MARRMPRRLSDRSSLARLCTIRPQGGDEYVELQNLTSSVVNLYDSSYPQDTWHLTGGISFIFPTGATIPANGYALVVNISPTYFRTKYSIPAGVPIYGPYGYSLGNGGDTVELMNRARRSPTARCLITV